MSDNFSLEHGHVSLQSGRASLQNGPGDRIDKPSEGFRFVADYGLLVCLGEGGMGEVWAARDASSPKNHIVALKTTKQHGLEAARVLYDEARIASLIEHPNVCRVHHLGKAGDVQYLVMDYCDGASLHALLEAHPDRKLPYDMSCRILAGAAAGLHAAHILEDEEGTALGVVHRDVSPQNILISTKGLVMVTDFGVAKALGQAHKATETGEMKGKLSYMAPEQVTSKEIDARADVFALGCVLYQVSLGQRPFHGDDALSTLYRLLEEELTLPSALDPNFPPDLEAVIVKSLSKERDQRFQSAAEFQRALEGVLLHLGARVTDDDVAALMKAHLGESVGARKEEIRRRNEALSRFDRSKQSGSDRRNAAPPASRASRTDSNEATLVSEPPTRPHFRKGSKVTALLLFLFVVAGGLVTLKLTQESKNVPEPVISAGPELMPEEPTTEQAPSTNPSGPVTLEVTVTPNSAKIFLDGKAIGEGSIVQEVERSSKGHVLLLTSDGYESVTRAVVFDKNQSITIALSPDSAEKKAAPQPKPVRKPQGKPAPATAPLPRKTPTKPPRKLDPDNPFANP